MSVSYIFSELGGCLPVAKELGYPPSTVQNWKNRGNIPKKYWASILELAEKNKKNIGIEHLIGISFSKKVINKSKKHRSN